jgi:hypothetical protein
VARSICWATHEEAERLGVAGNGTRHWAYRWIEEHVKRLAPVELIADIGGGGIDAVLAGLLAPYARRVLILDQACEPCARGRVETVKIDLEQGLRGIADESVDVFVTASSVEHLSAAAQQRLFADAQRALKANGVFCGSISYIAGLDARALQLLAIDAGLRTIGSNVYAPFDLSACLAAAPGLAPPFPPVDWSLFPGFGRFEESRLLGNPALVAGRVGSYGTVRCSPELDALQLRWFEVAFFLQKRS